MPAPKFEKTFRHGGLSVYDAFRHEKVYGPMKCLCNRKRYHLVCNFIIILCLIFEH